MIGLSNSATYSAFDFLNAEDFYPKDHNPEEMQVDRLVIHVTHE